MKTWEPTVFETRDLPYTFSPQQRPEKALCFVCHSHWHLFLRWDVNAMPLVRREMTQCHPRGMEHETWKNQEVSTMSMIVSMVFRDVSWRSLSSQTDGKNVWDLITRHESLQVFLQWMWCQHNLWLRSFQRPVIRCWWHFSREMEMVLGNCLPGALKMLSNF